MTNIVRLTFVILGLVSMAYCHRAYRGPQWINTAGYRYRAGAALVGPERDTLRVAVVVVNESNQQRALTFSHCPQYTDAVKARVFAGGRNWDSEVYEDRQHLPPGDSTSKTMAYICGGISMMTFPPGATYTSVLKVPIREILGDSLPSGRYRVTARLMSDGGDGRKLDAGDVEF